MNKSNKYSSGFETFIKYYVLYKDTQKNNAKIWRYAGINYYQV